MATDLQLLSEKAHRRAALAEAGLGKSLPFHILSEKMCYLSYYDIFYEKQFEKSYRLCIENNIHTFFIPPVLLPFVLDHFAGTKLKIGTIIDYPYSGLPPSIKGDLIRWAEDNGVEEIIVTLRADVMHENKGRERVRQALLSYGKCLDSDIPLYFAFDGHFLSESQIITFVRYSEMAGVSGVICLNLRRRLNILRDVAVVRSATPNSMSVGVLGNIKTWQEVETLSAAGADITVTMCDLDDFRYPLGFRKSDLV
ncbi:hypothetical protein [Aminobacterium colombiense]|jgi:deoxyribose-phosphate aldolase|uniref:hypothetical protein n=2 Tax=Aminobacterium TaxID=81466 RepID=UPI0025935EE1|nr:hypothetical protein [uncultured Aminobacterium sp.]